LSITIHIYIYVFDIGGARKIYVRKVRGVRIYLFIWTIGDEKDRELQLFDARVELVFLFRHY